MLRRTTAALMIVLLALWLTVACGGQEGEEVTPPEEEESVEITLYFPDDQAERLSAETRRVKLDGEEIPYVVIRELLKGPESPDLLASIPASARLLAVTVRDGIAYVNFSSELRTEHWGGSTGEIMTVYSIVNSLTELPEIERVKILVEGETVDTLAGHLDLTEPLARDESLLK